MERLRSYYDADRTEQGFHPTAYKTERNTHKVYCGVCGEMFFIDDVLFDEMNKMIERILENPFLCEGCIEEYDDLAHQNQN